MGEGRSDKRLNRIAWVGALLLLGGVGWPLLAGRVYTETDLGNFHLPMRHFYAQALASGHDFIWFPYEYLGFYLHGEGQASLFHPLNLLSYRLLPLDVAFNLELVRNYVFLLAGTFWLMRRWKARRDAAVLAAILFTFSSFNLLHFMHLNVVAIAAHLPFALVAIDFALRARSREVSALAGGALSLLTASQLLFGHPQIVWLSLLAEAGFALFVAWREVRWRRLPLLLLAQGLAFALAAIQLLPQWESLATSHRADPGAEFAFSLALDPVNLNQFVAPLLFADRTIGEAEATEFSLYCGALAPVMLAWLWIRRRKLGGLGPGVAAALVMAAVALLLATGEQGGLYRLQAALPVVGLFRAPARFILLFQLGMAMAVALAFIDLARVSESRERPPGSQLWPLLLPLLAGLAVVAFWSFARAWPLRIDFVSEVSNPLRLAIGPLALAAAAAIVALAARGRHALLGLIIVFAVVDHGLYGLSFVWRVPPVALERFVEARRIPPWSDRHRMHWGPPALTMRKVRLASGYVAMVPRRRLHTDVYILSGPPDRSLIAALRVANVGFAYGAPVPDPMDRVRLVARSERVRDLNRQIGEIDVATTALVERDLELPGGEPGRALLLSDLPGAFEIETSADATRLLVLSESWHVGWQASVDGEPAEVLRVYGDLMGCIVPQGVHQVVFRFDPDSLRRGKQISLLGLLGLLPLYGFGFWLARMPDSMKARERRTR